MGIKRDVATDFNMLVCGLLDDMAADQWSVYARRAYERSARIVAATSRNRHAQRGRKFGRRPGLTIRWDRVFKEAPRRNVAIELDGDPARQDLDYGLVCQALDAC